MVEIVEDNALMIATAQEKADELNQAHPDLNITWRELAHLPTPDGVNVSVTSDLDDGGSEDNGGGNGE